jgi:hypothetical protein
MPSEPADSDSTAADVPAGVEKPVTGGSSSTTNDDTLAVQHSSEPSSTVTTAAANATVTSDDVQLAETQVQKVCAFLTPTVCNGHQPSIVVHPSALYQVYSSAALA